MKEAITREELYREIILGEDIRNQGIYFGNGVVESLDFEESVEEQIRVCMDNNYETCTQIRLPRGVKLPSSFRIEIAYRQNAPYHIELEDGHYLLYKEKQLLYEVSFIEKPGYFNHKTSDGVSMATIAQEVGKTKLIINYSNECSLRDKGLDCRFCNINTTKNHFGELQGIEWKNPRQIAETVQTAYAEGYESLIITGGFIPERREVEYYIDTAEEIRDYTGLEEFGGTACIGAPADLSVIEKYREAGYSTISSNMEIWDENIFKTICPGKDQICGGRANWIAALKEELRVFGKGNVRSFFVAGIEPKSTLLDGLDYLISLGVVAIPLHWIPNVGSDLEGHQAPTVEWYLDLYEKTYKLLKKNGVTHSDYYRCANNENSIFDYFYDLDGDFLPSKRHNADAISFIA